MTRPIFVAMVALHTPRGWRAGSPVIGRARPLALTAGMTLVLICTELFTFSAICLWRASVHVITFLVFALGVTRR